eukprot:Hpha_TRINITY_DN10778_c0_g1::TRINITY_DN10778_c0_g1_i1::g.43679::m.43679
MDQELIIGGASMATANHDVLHHVVRTTVEPDAENVCERPARSLLRHVLFVIIYVFVGGLVFHFLENPGEKARYSLAENRLAELNISGAVLQDLEKIGFCKFEQTRHWDLTGSTFFAMTVVTTIGYGNATPDSVMGRFFTVLFALGGISFVVAALGEIATSLMILGQGVVEAASKLNRQGQLTEQALRDADDIFDKFDTDKSGAIDAGELAGFLQVVGGGVPVDARMANHILARADADGSGDISRDELMGVIAVFYQLQATMPTAVSWTKMSVVAGVLVVWGLSWSIAISVVEDWYMGYALWWAFVTLSTIGFGDWAPITSLGRILSFPFVLFGLGALAWILSAVSQNLASHRFWKVQEEERKTGVKNQARTRQLQMQVTTPRQSSTAPNWGGAAWGGSSTPRGSGTGWKPQIPWSRRERPQGGEHVIPRVPPAVPHPMLAHIHTRAIDVARAPAVVSNQPVKSSRRDSSSRRDFLASSPPPNAPRTYLRNNYGSPQSGGSPLEPRTHVGGFKSVRAASVPPPQGSAASTPQQHSASGRGRKKLGRVQSSSTIPGQPLNGTETLLRRSSFGARKLQEAVKEANAVLKVPPPRPELSSLRKIPSAPAGSMPGRKLRVKGGLAGTYGGVRGRELPRLDEYGRAHIFDSDAKSSTDGSESSDGGVPGAGPPGADRRNFRVSHVMSSPDHE